VKSCSCATLIDLEAESVDVEVNFMRGMPRVNVVGLPSGEIQESKERVKSALISSGFQFPPQVVTINLAPSDTRKSGSHFDLSIALTIALFSYSDIDLSEWYIFGELGLDGVAKDTKAIFPTLLSLRKQGLVKRVLVPQSSVDKVSKIPDIEIYGVPTLSEAIDFFRGTNPLKPLHSNNSQVNKLKVGEDNYYFSTEFELDFKDVFGQLLAKRASLISVAGMHNIILEGSPGSGKSMIAKRLPYILPPVGESELLQIAKLQSLDGKEPTFEARRPFRSPHHTASRGSIFGGGTRTAKIGEVSLADSGILFFDELPHFPKQILEAMREPLQDYKILVSRVQNKVEYPANFLFVGAMNPCPCGYLLSQKRSCRCSDLEIKRYRGVLSEPFWDRIDLYVAMSESSIDDKKGVSSAEMYQSVLKAFKMQIERGQQSLNGRLSDEEMERFIEIDTGGIDALRKASERFNLSFRAINKIKKVARTVADLEESKIVTRSHIVEAISYRKR
jgi:magnesium chelatase family protein